MRNQGLKAEPEISTELDEKQGSWNFRPIFLPKAG